jgi:hypothetical protein
MALPAPAPKPFDLNAELEVSREKLHRTFFAAFEEADVMFSPDQLAKEVTQMLTKERREIVLKLMGFNTRWGDIEVDSSNGNSMVSKYINEVAKDAVREWLDNHLRGAFEAHVRGKMSDTKVVNAALKEFAGVFSDALRTNLRDMAKELAYEQAQEFRKQVLKTMSLSSN